MNEAKRLSCMVCCGDHEPSTGACDSAGMDRQIEKLGARRWNALTAHISKVNNRRLAINPPTQSHLAGKGEL